MSWRDEAMSQIMCARIDPDFTPRYRVPARKWWQFWKPKWQWIEGISENAIRRVRGLEPRVTCVRARVI